MKSTKFILSVLLMIPIAGAPSTARAQVLSEGCIEPAASSLCEALPDWICYVAVEEETSSSSGRELEASITGFVTTGSQAGDQCAIALDESRLGTVTSVEVAAFRGKAIRGLEYRRHDPTAWSLELGRQQFDAGFAGTTATRVRAGQLVELKLRITPARGVTAEAAEQALRETAFATGSADTAGAFDGRALVVQPPRLSSSNR